MMRDGFHRPGSPNMTTAEPPNWNMAVSAPRVNGISTEWIWTNSDRHDPISTRATRPKWLVCSMMIARSLTNRLSSLFWSAFRVTVHQSAADPLVLKGPAVIDVMQPVVVTTQFEGPLSAIEQTRSTRIAIFPPFAR
jgi:hypothetical protein